MAAPVVYGPAYSTYTRTARLALEEKGVDYKLEEVDILSGAGQSPAHLARHPLDRAAVRVSLDAVTAAPGCSPVDGPVAMACPAPFSYSLPL